MPFSFEGTFEVEYFSDAICGIVAHIVEGFYGVEYCNVVTEL